MCLRYRGTSDVFKVGFATHIDCAKLELLDIPSQRQGDHHDRHGPYRPWLRAPAPGGRFLGSACLRRRRLPLNLGHHGAEQVCVVIRPGLGQEGVAGLPSAILGKGRKSLWGPGDDQDVFG